MRNIKEIRAEMAKLREEYEARITMLEEEIVAVRDRRGYVAKSKAGSDEPYHEAGRSRMPGYYEADGGSMWNGVGRSYF
jgi:hypothetical protein